MSRLLCVLTSALLSVTVGLSAEQSGGKTKVKGSAPATQSDALRSTLGKLAIEGNPSTLVSCVGGSDFKVFPLGSTTAGTRIKVDIISGEGIDPVASLTVLQMGNRHPEGRARASLAFDDDSGGNLDPRVEMTTEYEGNVVLSVGSFDGSFGCFWVKVDVRVP